MSSQVRMGGMGGVVGMDLNALIPLLTIMEVPRSRWRYALDLLLVLGNIQARYVNTQKEH